MLNHGLGLQSIIGVLNAFLYSERLRMEIESVGSDCCTSEGFGDHAVTNLPSMIQFLKTAHF